MFTTLRKIKKHDPCREGWAKLLAHLGKTKADDEPLSLLAILESNGLDDALWALRAVNGYEKEMRLYACDCAKRVLSIYEKEYPGDDRPRKAIDVARLYAEGKATREELAAARDAARDAAWDAAGDAAWDAARDAAGDAARAAARAAARDAAWDAAGAARAARAAWGEEKAWQTHRFIAMCEACK